jgi:subtilisin family serine protease
MNRAVAHSFKPLTNTTSTMKIRTLVIALGLILPVAESFAQNLPRTKFKGRSCVAGRLLIKPTPGIMQANALSSAQQNARITHVTSIAADGTMLVRFPTKRSLASVMAAYRKAGVQATMEPDYIMQAYSGQMIPNDPDFKNQWALHQANDKDIDAPEAWARARKANSMVVAVIDSGVDYNHPDLRANMWVNTKEIPGNGIDDDGNGYIDDVFGINVDEGRNQTSGNPMDNHGHGTHVAGSIGAVGNNGVGIAGVCHEVRLMALKFLHPFGSGATGTTSDAVKCVDYARLHGAHVINASFGGGGRSQIFEDAIKRANDAGIVFVAAAGNNGTSTPTFPASYNLPNIICVANTNSNDVLASSSSFGSWVHLAAPGTNILSTLPNNRYGYFTGTSMAAPHVAGTVALVRSLNPTLSPTNIRNRILTTVDPIPSLLSKVSTGGRLNLYNALQGKPEEPKPDDHGNTPGNATLAGTFTGGNQLYSVQGKLEVADDVDVFRLVLNKKASVRFYSTSTGDPDVRIKNASGTVLGTDRDTGSNRNYDITRVLDPGTYFAEVFNTGKTDTPAYTAHFQCSEIVQPPPPAAISVRGPLAEIPNGDTTPSGAEGTDFGVVQLVASPTKVHGFHVRNTGGQPLTINNVSISGTNAPRFSIETLPSSTVQPGQATTLAIRFTGTREGLATAKVQFNTSDSRHPTFSFDLAGTGIADVDDLPNDVPSQFNLALNSTFNGRLEYERDNDVVRVYAPSNGVLEAWTSGSTDTYGYIYDGARSNYKLLSENNDSAGAKQFLCRATVDRGYYHIRVRGMGGVTGNYRLHVKFTAR